MSEDADLFDRLAAALPTALPEPARLEAVERFEAEVGGRLPELMRRVYLELCDGGWGPDYGVLGLDHGQTDDRGDRIPEIWRGLTEPPPEDAENGEDEHLVLEKSWIPFLHVGCAMHYCVDTASGRCALIDPTTGIPAKESKIWEGESFFEFVRLWLDGELDEAIMEGVCC